MADNGAMSQQSGPGPAPEPGDRQGCPPGARPEGGPARRRRRRATGGVPPTREVADVTPRDTAEDWREGGSDDDRITREVPPHW